MKFLTAYDDVMKLGHACVKWRAICKPVWRTKKSKELSVAWAGKDHIPSAEEVVIVELLVSQNPLLFQIITGKVAAVSEFLAKEALYLTEAEVAFVAILASNGQIPRQILAN